LPEASIIKGELDVGEVIGEISESTGSEGAIVIFLGVVKGVVDGKKVFKLKYEAYEPLASRTLKKIVREESKGVGEVRVYHRVGVLTPGEPAVYIFVRAGSRVKAFETTRKVLERVKHEVPIYKLEVREDGEFWVIGDNSRYRKRK